MTDGDALLRAILDEPADDAPRLVYADWLEENGQPERAEFIRVQCGANLGVCEMEPNSYGEPFCLSGSGRLGRPFPCHYCALRRRERELLRLEWATVPDALDGAARKLKGVAGFRVFRPGDADFVFRRGFVEKVVCRAADFLAHADALTAAQPITEVELTTWPEIDRQAEGRGVRCRIRGRQRWSFTHSRITANAVEEALAAEWPRIRFTLPPP